MTIDEAMTKHETRKADEKKFAITTLIRHSAFAIRHSNHRRRPKE
jgi:hypothetical protein